MKSKKANHQASCEAVDPRALEVSLLDLFNTMTEGIAYTTLSGEIIFVNQALEEMMGVSAAEMVGRNIIPVARKLLTIENLNPIMPLLVNLLQGRRPEDFHVDYHEKVLEVSVNISSKTERITGIVRDVTDRLKFEKDLIDLDQRARKQRSAIASLVACQVDNDDDFLQLLRTITQLAAETTGSDRSGVWFFNEDFSALECEMLYDKSQKQHSSGGRLKVKDYPVYFEALKAEGFVKASDAQTDQLTRELVKNGLKSLNVSSMMDVGVFVRERLAGIICHKHFGTPHVWHPDEEAFLHTMAALIGQVIANRDRRKAESDLLKSQVRFRELFDMAADGILLGSPKGVVLEANAAFYEMTGLEPKVVIGKPITDIPFDPECIVENPFRYDLIDGGQTVTRQRSIFHPDGSSIYVEMISRKLPDGHYQSHMRNITARKRAEMALQESEEKFSKAFRLSPFLLTITRLSDGKFLAVNDSVLPMSGYTREEALSSSTINIQIWRNPNDRKTVVDMLQRGEAVKNMEFLFRKKGGAIMIGSISCQLFTLQDEICILSTLEDVTERKEAERELQVRMDELERFHKLTVGRELTMIELKLEINKLLKEAGKDEKYRIVESKMPGNKKPELQ